ncbi:hypothetical protein BCR44DRAFT_1131891 [Catenaria anguillulae PL171]|uniref:Uncharacterized protein n=1 Tax=Catenaria anguillulae PL171 TaxID=765915 RepID=A0A1Y2HKC6_9FUNG|nr:hypothetical protein BCR44DRAFT_1131891 [Catenaria anguillulae PL171]
MNFMISLCGDDGDDDDALRWTEDPPSLRDDKRGRESVARKFHLSQLGSTGPHQPSPIIYRCTSLFKAATGCRSPLAVLCLSTADSSFTSAAYPRAGNPTLPPRFDRDGVVEIECESVLQRGKPRPEAINHDDPIQAAELTRPWPWNLSRPSSLLHSGRVPTIRTGSGGGQVPVPSSSSGRCRFPAGIHACTQQVIPDAVRDMIRTSSRPRGRLRSGNRM